MATGTRVVAGLTFALLSLINCSTVYNVHIRTIPEGDYDIYYDKQKYGVLPPSGDTTIQFPKISVMKTPMLELRGVDRYGCFRLSINDSPQTRKNVQSFQGKGYSKRNWDIVFNFNKPVDTPQRLQNKIKPDLNSLEIKKLSSSPIHYCVADLQLLQKGIKAYDYDNTEFKIMKKYVDENIRTNGYSWDTVSPDLTRRITLGLADDTTNNPDSLPYAAWDLAASQKIKYLVVFYGYSLLESRGVAPETAAASVALTALGILIGVNTGYYTVVYPTGKDRKSVMDSYCAVFSIDSNTCLYNGKASLTAFNNSTIANQIAGLYSKLFNNIKPFFSNNPESARNGSKP